MDGQIPSISPHDLYARLGTAGAPLVLDVRRAAAFDQAEHLITSGIRRSPDDVQTWRQALPASRQIVAYCVHGHEVSQRTHAALRSARIDAAYLEGGIQAWKA